MLSLLLLLVLLLVLLLLLPFLQAQPLQRCHNCCWLLQQSDVLCRRWLAVLYAVICLWQCAAEG
jgi:hypothetical protein